MSAYRRAAVRPMTADVLRAGDLVEVVAPGVDQEWRRGMYCTVAAVTRDGVLVDGGAEFLWFREISRVGAAA